MTPLTLVFPSTFFSEHTKEYAEAAKTAETDTIDVFTQIFGEVYTESVRFLDTFTGFNPTDEFEIGRGDFYRVDPSLPQKVTLATFKDFLARKNITDEAFQNLILGLLLQSQIGVAFAIGKTLTGFLLGLEVGLLTLPSDTQKTSLVFNRDGGVTFHLSMPVSSCKDGRYKSFGQADMRIQIQADKQIHFSGITLQLKGNEQIPLPAIRAKLEATSQREGIPTIAKLAQSAAASGSTPGQSKDAPHPVSNWLQNNRWKIAAFTGAVVMGGIGVALAATGIFSPIGVLLMGIGVKLSLTGAGLLAADAGLSLGAGVIAGTLMNGIAHTFTKVTNAITAKLASDTYVVKPSPVTDLHLSKAVTLAASLHQQTEALSERSLLQPLGLESPLARVHPPEGLTKPLNDEPESLNKRRMAACEFKPT